MLGSELWILTCAIAFAVAALLAFRIAYVFKGYPPLPSRKPIFCPLPKYHIYLPINGGNFEEALDARLSQYGFYEERRTPNRVTYGRGADEGNFSVNVAKVIVTAERPVSSPVELKVEYGALYGWAFDTGDLYRFCKELVEKIEYEEEMAWHAAKSPYRLPRT